jgi:hypothetical protein
MSMKACWKSEASMPGLMWPHLRHPREVGAMVEEQAAAWTLKRSGCWDPVPGTWPVVTISGEAGDPSHGLGRGLAERLGFSYWDRALVLELVRLLNVQGTSASTLGARTQAAIEAFLGDPSCGRAVTPMDDLNRPHLVLDSIVRRGGAVIVGQGAQFLVAPRDALRVRLVVSVQQPPIGGQLGHPTDFDVVVNAGTYERERAVSLVLMAYLAKFGDWPLTARALLEEPRARPVALLPPKTPSRLMDEGRVQEERRFTNAVRTVVKLA